MKEKIPKQFAIRIHDVARFFAKPIQVLERGDSEKLSRVNWRRTKEIIQPAHLPCEVRTRQDPAASQSADAVNLRQTAGHYELWPETERRARRSLVNRIQINLIHQHQRANAAGDVANFTQNRVGCKYARRIVQVRDHDAPRSGSTPGCVAMAFCKGAKP